MANNDFDKSETSGLATAIVIFSCIFTIIAIVFTIMDLGQFAPS